MQIIYSSKKDLFQIRILGVTMDPDPIMQIFPDLDPQHCRKIIQKSASVEKNVKLDFKKCVD
jgi:hypothetical protein